MQHMPPTGFPLQAGFIQANGKGKNLQAGLLGPTSGGKNRPNRSQPRLPNSGLTFTGQAPDCGRLNQAVRGDPGYPGQHDSARMKVLLSPTSPHFGHFNFAAGFIFSYISLPQRPQRMWSSWATSSVGISSRRHSGHCNEGMMLPPFGNCHEIAAVGQSGSTADFVVEKLASSLLVLAPQIGYLPCDFFPRRAPLRRTCRP